MFAVPQRQKSFGATNIDEIFTWVDASYAVNYDMKNDIGGTMSMGLGVTHRRSIKINLNTKISTESDLVSASDYIP